MLSKNQVVGRKNIPGSRYLEKTLNASRPSEHPLVRGR